MPWRRLPTCASRTDFASALRALGEAHKTVRLDQTTAVEALGRLVTEAGGKVDAGRRSDHRDEGGEERGRDRRRARGAAPRRRGDRALPRLVRPRGAERAAERDRLRGGARNVPTRDRRAQGRRRSTPSPAPARTARSCTTASPQATNRTLAPGELFLLDSGGQYRDGTTDITRTIAVGAPSEEMRDRFTRVLKGHIAIARAVFPDGTPARSSTASRGITCGQAGARLRPRHRPRRRHLPRRARRPGAHPQVGNRRRSSPA